MSDAFRDAIAQSIDSTYFFGTEEPYEENVTEANAILAMPEMVAIRQALHACTIEYGFGGKSRQAEVLYRLGLPEHVVAWVVGHE